ncbi:IclR family transcriptional regulator [Curtobacterium ammoniigenes]|uniref:IclR family transcriptional regulator n=1 Tax=Curtobacterium ammoniigenes TaxID=395387 RepID=UPI00083322C0|nr:IclR family transcriptional regulator C-terminal domain-containing protein [Curtobacterium ammoniigenes]
MPSVPAARNVLRVIIYLSDQTGPTHAATIARDLDLPRSSVYHLLTALQDAGFLLHFPEERSYALSPLLGELGSSVDRAGRLRRLGAPLLARLIAEAPVPVVAQIGTLSGTDVVYAAKESGLRAPATVSAIGVRLPAHLTATGRAILAALDRAQVRALFPTADALAVRGASGPRTMRAFEATLQTARERGWASERDEITAGYASVAAAALDRRGTPVAAVTLTYRTAVVDAATEQLLGQATRRGAAALSQRMQGRR